MKKFIWLALLLIILILAFRGCDDRSENDKMIENIFYNTSKVLKDRYHIHEMSSRTSGIVGTPYYFEVLGLGFSSYRVLSKDEGRKMLIDCAETLLKEINSNLNLLPFLKPSPFTINNVEIAIYDYQPDGQLAYYPDILIFAFRDGEITYRTKVPEHQFGYHTEEIETYEEAKRIIQGQLTTE